MGSEVARDEVIQAEPSWEAAGWGLHAWVKVGGLRVCQWLLCVSSVGKQGGRESPAGPGLPVPSGREGGDSCGRGSGPAEWELQDPGNRPLWAPACRLPVPAPRGTMGCLLGPGQELRVGVGEGRPGEERTCWTKPQAGLLASPSGALTAQSACSPRGKADGTGAAGRGGPGTRDCVSVPSASPSPCVSISSPAGTGVPQAQEEALGNSKATHPRPSRAKVPGRRRAWGHFQAAGTTPSELRGVSISSLFRPLWLKRMPQRGQGVSEGWGQRGKQWLRAKLDLCVEGCCTLSLSPTPPGCFFNRGSPWEQQT